MKRLLFLFLLISVKTYAQSPFDTLYFLDKETKEPVPYVSCQLGKQIYYSDLNGAIAPGFANYDTLFLSRMGYKNLSIPLEFITDTIYLDPKINSLSEVKITAKRQSVEIGYHDKKNLGTAGSGSRNQMVTLINGNQITGLVKTVYIHLKQQQKGGLYRINLFSIADDRTPGELIYAKDYISPNSKNLLEIDISDAAIDLPGKGIFVGVDVIRDENGFAGPVRVTKTFGDPISYFFSVNRWFENDNLIPEWNMTYKIGLEVISF